MTEDDIMLTHLLNCKRADLYSREIVLTKEQQASLNQMRQRRLNHEPLQYILNETDFMGRVFKVNSDVLIPRPETEILVELAVLEMRSIADVCKNAGEPKKINILDLGCGSGNIAVTLAKEVANCRITAVDKSLKAIKIAQENAKIHEACRDIEFVCQDMINYLADQCSLGQTFDLIISNPPYIRTELINRLQKEVQYEPRIALDGGIDGMDYCSQIIGLSEALLKERGVLLMEVGDDQRKPIEGIFQNFNSKRNLSFIKDYRQFDRIVKIFP